MEGFARRTGLRNGEEERRYLWTDAFAVLNYLTLHHRGDREALGLAVHLAERVHHVLGRYRSDDARRGWISGLSGSEGERHPTAGGLRIGKPLPERAPWEAPDPALEWEQDGQYFHYLTRWMQALVRLAAATGDAAFRGHALELGRVAWQAFSHAESASGALLYWKMSTDLSRPLVLSQGGHDPLDALVTFCVLRHRASRAEVSQVWPGLDQTVEELSGAVRHGMLRTDDPLGIGGLSLDASRLARLGPEAAPDGRLLQRLLQDALRGLEAYAGSDGLRRSPARRLAFRELGLALGIEAMHALVSQPTLVLTPHHAGYSRLAAAYKPMAEDIVSVWLNPEARATEAWVAHRDINEVMLASALAPDECLAV
jgi:hypothetical protein